jgi:hypothetical protein
VGLQKQNISGVCEMVVDQAVPPLTVCSLQIAKKYCFHTLPDQDWGRCTYIES